MLREDCKRSPFHQRCAPTNGATWLRSPDPVACVFISMESSSERTSTRGVSRQRPKGPSIELEKQSPKTQPIRPLKDKLQNFAFGRPNEVPRKSRTKCLRR